MMYKSFNFCLGLFAIGFHLPAWQVYSEKRMVSIISDGAYRYIISDGAYRYIISDGANLIEPHPTHTIHSFSDG